MNATRPHWLLVDIASGNGDTDLCQHWLRRWLVVWQHQALNKCWLIINGHIWHLAEVNFTETALDFTDYKVFENYIFEINTLGPRRNEQHFEDDIFKRIFFNENVWIAIKISLKFVPKGPTDNIPALVQIMAWRRSGDKPLSEPMMVTLPTHICVIRPQWV